MPPPIGVEFGQIFRELGLGLPLAETLAGFAERVPLSDVEIFVTAINIQHRTGGNLSDILQTIAETCPRASAYPRGDQFLNGTSAHLDLRDLCAAAGNRRRPEIYKPTLFRTAAPTGHDADPAGRRSSRHH